MAERDPRQELEHALAENQLLRDEVYVARRASQITARQVVRQFGKMEEIHNQLEEKAAAERTLTERLGTELRESEQREKDLAEARKAAEAANRSKSTFLANMSHELRTPLNAIIGYSELVEEELEDEGFTEVIPDLQKINAAGKHLLTLINEILDLSKIEAGKLELYEEVFDIGDAVRDVVSTIKPLIDKNNNRIEVDCPPEVGSIYSDLVRVRQCMFNLLSNASKFTEDGVIKLTVERTPAEPLDLLTVSVTDSGIGMSQEQVGKLFQPFTQADASSTRKYGGTGLGLTITKRFVEKMGGVIEVLSEVGVGSTFRFRVPAREVPVQAPGVSYDPDDRGSISDSIPEGAPTVLAIDDDESVLEWMRRSLGSAGLRVITATNGADGLRLAHELQPAAIVLDVVMPGMDGWAVLAEIKASPELSDTPVIVVSVIEDRNLGFALGVSDYLTKPVDRGRLLTVLNRFCDGLTEPILVVEDDDDTRDALRRTLEREGWKVNEAINGIEGLEKVAAEPPGMILLDLMMPEMDGFEFVETLRQREEWRYIPVVVVTAKDLTQYDRARLHDRVQNVLQKGAYGRDDLLGEIKRQVAAHVDSIVSVADGDRVSRDP